MGKRSKRSRREEEEEEHDDYDVAEEGEEEDIDGYSYRGDRDSEDDSGSDQSVIREEEDDEEKYGRRIGHGDEAEDVANGIAGAGGEEMEELEKQYLSIRNEQQSLLNDLKRQKDDDYLKGQAVKNQKTLWHRSLEFRFLLQKAFSSSNRLPQDPVRSLLCNSDESVSQAFAGFIMSSNQALSCFNELQEALIQNNPSIDQGDNGRLTSTEGSDDEDWLRISRMQQRIIPFRNSAIDKWHRKTQVTTGAAAFKGKLHAFNQNISDQVTTYMRDPNRMITRMKLRKSAVGVLGEVTTDASDKKEEVGDMEGDPELLDDSEFYQQLLKEFFETCDIATSDTVYYAVKKMQSKKRKVVDRRASKSRKIRYTVHEKMVNFMAPKPGNFNDMSAKLFENLFGQKSQKPVATA